MIILITLKVERKYLEVHIQDEKEDQDYGWRIKSNTFKAMPD